MNSQLVPETSDYGLLAASFALFPNVSNTICFIRTYLKGS